MREELRISGEALMERMAEDYEGRPTAKEYFETAKSLLASGDLQGAMGAADMALSMNHLEGYKSARLVIGLQKQIKAAMRGDGG